VTPFFVSFIKSSLQRSTYDELAQALMTIRSPIITVRVIVNDFEFSPCIEL
jgi:hypothetical protein